MIYISISSSDRTQLEATAMKLLREHLVVDLNLSKSQSRLRLVDENLEEHEVYVLSGKTKALLFPEIDQLVKDLFPDKIPEIYAYPIVYMDWDQAKQLKSEVRSV